MPSEPLSRSSTVLSVAEQVQHDLFPGEEAKLSEPFLVQFDLNDPDNPKNWSRAKKWYLTFLSGLLVLNATFASSSPSGVAEDLIKDLHMSEELATLTIALFVAGYCIGPLLWGPLSEQYGRRPVFLLGFGVYTCFQVGCALAPNTASLTVFRVLGGTFAACPLSNSGALISDVWDARDRAKALAIFTLAPFAGPALGPACSGYIETAGVSWRWVFWVLTAFAGVCFIIIFLTLPETYAPVLLVKKAAQKRKETGNDQYQAPLEVEQNLPLTHRLESIVARPFKVLFQEPMLLAITIYMSFVYGVLYMLFEAYPIVFTEGHHLNAGASGLMFLPLFGGGVLGVALYLLILDPRYVLDVEKFAPLPVPPEYRLTAVMYSGPLFAITFFWFGWTSYPSISFWAPMMSGTLMGWSITWIFLGLFSYIIDCYLSVAASALAANTVCRSIFGAAFPLFATQMFNALNPRWASSLLGCIAVLVVPIPFVLHRFGPWLRLKSKHAPTGKPPSSSPM